MYDGIPQNTSPMLDAALQYAGRGWCVFPVKPRGKTPLTKRGFKDASKDVEQIAAWWRKWPDANVGIATGQVSGIIVLDVDGPTGLIELKRLLVLYGRLPSTAVALTARGCHIYLKGNMVCKCSSGGSLDVRGDGGYVVAPPSVHETGAVYRWERLP